jgi:DNA polymerase
MTDASDFVPADTRSLARLRTAAQECRGCPLWQPATQAVFGAGPARAEAILVGEAPGEREDEQGTPFVGPAGRELDRALALAGIPRRTVYVTNAVKHFKFEERGKRRIHQRPSRSEVKACWPWLDTEIKRIRPAGILAMGATAATQLAGPKVRVTQDRGVALDSELAGVLMVTIHPSAILRARDSDERDAMRRDFARDLTSFARAIRSDGAAQSGSSS